MGKGIETVNMADRGDVPSVAVIGCGYWGKNLVRNFHALGALGMVCDPIEAGRTHARELVSGIEVVNDVETVLLDERIAAVAISPPAETHRELTERCLQGGKDVFVEKPMALTAVEGESMEAIAEKKGRILMVGHLLEYHPAILKLRELIDSGELGNVNYVYSNRLNFGKVRTEENALWSFAPHDVAVILRLFGCSPVQVTASGGSYLIPNLADVTVSCLRFADGGRAHIFVSWLHPFKEQRLVVVGDEKMAVFDDVASHEHKLVLYPNRVDFEDHLPVLRKEDAQPVEFSQDEPLRCECEYFLNRIRDRKQPLTDAASGIAVLRVLGACQESLETHGAPVSLQTTACNRI